MSNASKKDLAFERNPRRIQDKEHRWIADIIYRCTFGEVEIRRVDDQPLDDAVMKALDILGVDFYVAFANGTLLAGQEKFLSYDCARFRTVTISEHSWRHCAAQIYFCGYLTADGRSFDPWVLLNWANMIAATARGDMKWKLTHSFTSYPSFWNTSIDNIPNECIIAGKL